MKHEILSTKDLREVIGKFLMFIAVEVCKSKHTVNAYRRDIDDFVASLSDSYQEHVSISTLESLDIKSIRKWIQSRSLRAVSPRSNIRAISAIRAFFKYLNENKIVHNNIIFDFKKPKVSHLLPRAIDHSDVMQLIQVAASMAKHHWQQKRDKAILLLMFSAGLRIEEALSITVSDAIERNFMYVNGKSNKQRLVPILSTVQSAILDYYNAAPFTLVGSDYLFVGNSCQKYGARAIQKKIAIARRILNLPDSVTPHTLRHSCATILLNSSNDIVKVKNLLGHSRLSTTQIYTKVTPQRIANELQRIDFWQ